MKRPLKLNINNDDCEVEAHPYETLLDVLRNELGLTGTKYGCGTGECGACTVLVDGKPVLSCLTLAADAEGRRITTIEGVANETGLHPIQAAFVEHGAIQCGYCTPGLVMLTKALLDETPKPTEQEIREFIKGNLCRCTGYSKIVEAILAASTKMTA
jgi:carbon-monoxide dehydrogenase small subunit